MPGGLVKETDNVGLRGRTLSDRLQKPVFATNDNAGATTAFATKL